MNESQLSDTSQDRTRFARQLKWWSIPFTGAILVSLVCNILALLNPFLEFSVAFKGKQFYSIPLTIQLMWEIKLYVAAVLVVGFSLIFPFIKLGILLIILWRPLKQSDRHKMLAFLRNMGRWSLLDVFVILTILVLANDQIFIGAVPRSGATLFLIAICTSMLISELLDYLNGGMSLAGKVPVFSESRSLYWQSGWTFWLMLFLFAVALLSLLAAMGLPYFQISQFLLKHKSYSVLDSIMVLNDSGAIVFAITMFAFLVVSPLAKLFLMMAAGLVPMTLTSRHRLSWWSSSIGAWSMLDVFGLALLLFMAEGNRLVEFQTSAGLYMIVLAVAISYFVLLLHGYAINRAQRRAASVP